ncbi:MAG: asparagine synthase (glutamine-hydrolyzing) [Bacteroidetes bacterium]|nr:asparagine synthase (glutamine-hydrolyzing) [Bacteroidota bacterium]
MCGIAGIFHFDESRNADKSLLKRMSDSIAHRGPDGENYYCSQNIGLAHRRLSIIDLSTGDQPMFNNEKSITIIFNGEIYNYIELRDELKKLSHKFKTNSDTEVIIRAYEQWGFDCQNKLNGMWAFSLWDNKKKQLFLSRDRLGEKPLYYSTFDNSFIFGSEIKSLLMYGCPATPNLELTELYLSLGYIPAPYTFYKNIFKLQAGHYLVVSNNSITEKKYWDMPMIDERKMISDKKNVYETYSTLLNDSVQIRMRSDVPYGAFLSGGLDSASVVALMSKLTSSPVRTFTIGFKEKSFDERNLAKEVAEKFKTNHEEFAVEPEVFDDELKKIISRFDEPFGDSSAIPTGYVSKIAAQKVKMVLTGDGGDEVLSGYESNRVEKFAEQYQHLPHIIRRAMPGAVSVLSNFFSGNIRYKLNRISKALSFSNKTFDERLMAKSWCKPELAEKLIQHSEKQIKLSDFIHNLFEKYPVKNPFYQLMYFQFKVLLPDDFLTKVDRMSMAYSLETRVPFLDYRLIEFMMHVHRDVKMNGYERKSVLRNTIGKQLPSSLLRAPKRGFSIPLREWFKDKAFEQKLQSLYNSDFGLSSSLIKELVSQNASGKEDLGNLLWMLFIYKKWIEKS